MWPWFRSRFDRRLNRALLVRALEPIVAALPGPTVAVTTVPIVADLVGRLPVARWVYYCVDDFGEWPGLDQAPLRAMERDLVRNASVLIAVSEMLQSRLTSMGRESHVLTHGVDLELWTARDVPEPPLWIEVLPRPLVVFWGVVDARTDAAFLARLGEEMSEGTIVLVGPRDASAPSFERLPRVVYRPPVPYESLPALARAVSVLILPYDDLPVTRALQPLKLKEYLATGKPVVARDLPSTRAWADSLDLADTPEQFAWAATNRLTTGLPAAQAQARGRLAAESWAEKAAEFERLLFGPDGFGSSLA
jgi:glycosyltransferase involved in cell wall biosynthesis